VFPHTRIRGPSLYYFRKVGGRVIEIRLGRLDEGETVLRSRYQELIKPAPRTVADMLTAWKLEEHRLAERTRKEYERYIDTQLAPVFGPMPINALSQKLVAQYLERRGNVAANREISCLSTVYEWGRRKGWAEDNPCRGIRRNRETPRHRYITNRDFGQALKRTTPEFRDFMLAAYLTGLRQGDLRSLRRDQLGKLGLQVEEGKTRRRVKMRWSNALHRLVERALARSGGPYVFTDTNGEPWGFWAVQSAMRRLDVDWTFHDLRAKAESDHATGLGLLSRYKRARNLEPVR
jgi:integrase